MADTGEMIPAERLLGGLPLIAVPAAWPPRPRPGAAARPGARPAAGRPGGRGAAGGIRGKAARPARLTRHARHTRLLPKVAVVQPKLVAASVALVTCAAGGTFAVVHAHEAAAPAALSVRPPAAGPAPSPRRCRW